MAKLLVVDDHVPILWTLQTILSDVGYEVRAAASGQAALEAIQSDPPELIITDVVMPGMTGLKLVEAIRALPGYDKLPALVISTSMTLERKAQIATLNNVTFLRKPFEVEVLLKTVAEILAV